MFKNKRLTKTTVCLLLLVLVIIFYTPVMCFADDEPQENNTVVSTKSPRVVVSMGDSFSSGEGIPPFYKDNTDWLAHRSEDSWPGQLELPNDMVEVFTGEGELIEEIQAEKISLKLKDYKHSFNPNAKDDDSILWYFVAASGAETKDILGQYEVEIYSGDGDLIEKIYETHGQEKTYSCCLLDSYHTVYLPPQIDVLFFLKEINIVPDYITLTLGGNDLGFERIIGEAAISYQNPNGLYLMLEEAEAKLKAENGVKDKLIDTYKAINVAAKVDAKQPCILVAGYPHLINPDIKNNALFDKTEADMINSKIDIFNQELEDAVRMCRENDHLDIWFVDVTKDFETHEAYTENAWLNGIQIRRWQDLDQKTIFPLNKLASAFSIHPNKQGAECYAKCVQRYINWKEGLDPNPSLTPRPTATPTSTPTPTPEPVIDNFAGYREVLVAYGSDIQAFEAGNSEYGLDESLTSCSLTDLTGDGFPELIVLYRSTYLYGYKVDGYYADVNIYTILPGETAATLMLSIPKVVVNPGFAPSNLIFSDVVFLSNGNLLFYTYGAMDKYHESFTRAYTEYTLDGNSYLQLNHLEYTSTYNGYTDEEEDSYFLNGTEVSEADYKSLVGNYIGKFNLVLVRNPKYESYTKTLDSEWINACLNTPDSSMSYDSTWKMALPVYNVDPVLTQEQALEAFDGYCEANIEREPDGETPYGKFSMHGMSYSEYYSDDYTCAYCFKGYLGAQTWTYYYYFMDLVTGSVYTINYDDLRWGAVEGAGIHMNGITYDVFNAFDYLE